MLFYKELPQLKNENLFINSYRCGQELKELFHGKTYMII